MRVELQSSAVTSGPSYDNVQMLEDDEGLEFRVTGTTSHHKKKTAKMSKFRQIFG